MIMSSYNVDNTITHTKKKAAVASTHTEGKSISEDFNGKAEYNRNVT